LEDADAEDPVAQLLRPGGVGADEVPLDRAVRGGDVEAGDFAGRDDVAHARYTDHVAATPQDLDVGVVVAQCREAAALSPDALVQHAFVEVAAPVPVESHAEDVAGADVAVRLAGAADVHLRAPTDRDAGGVAQGERAGRVGAQEVAGDGHVAHELNVDARG